MSLRPLSYQLLNRIQPEYHLFYIPDQRHQPITKRRQTIEKSSCQIVSKRTHAMVSAKNIKRQYFLFLTFEAASSFDATSRIYIDIRGSKLLFGFFFKTAFSSKPDVCYQRGEDATTNYYHRQMNKGETIMNRLTINRLLQLPRPTSSRTRDNPFLP